MKTKDIVELTQRLSATGCSLKPVSICMWRVTLSNGKSVDFESLEELRGWFRCWRDYVQSQALDTLKEDNRAMKAALTIIAQSHGRNGKAVAQITEIAKDCLGSLITQRNERTSA